MQLVMMVCLYFCLFLWGDDVFAAQICNSSAIVASAPTTDFVDNGDGTATDKTTGLMWKRCSEGMVWGGTICTGGAVTLTWQGALQQAKNTLSFAGFNDWRIPNAKELLSIVETQCSLPSVNATVFPNTMSAVYWTSSPDASNAANGWSVHFGDGSHFTYAKSTTNYVRLVRGGQ